jgi:hypothetical protein
VCTFAAVRRASNNAGAPSAVSAESARAGGGEEATAAPLTLISATPAPDAENAAFRDPIELPFSQPLDPKTVSGSSITLEIGGNAVAESVTLSADRRSRRLGQGLRCSLQGFRVPVARACRRNQWSSSLGHRPGDRQPGQPQRGVDCALGRSVVSYGGLPCENYVYL